MTPLQIQDAFIRIENFASAHLGSFFHKVAKTPKKTRKPLSDKAFAKQQSDELNRAKAFNEVTKAVAWVIGRSGTDPEKMVTDYAARNIIDPAVLIEGGNIFDFSNKEYHELIKQLSASRPTGLGSPRAASGEYELMFFVLSPDVGLSKKKSAGDLTSIYKGLEKKIELKSDGSSINTLVSGKNFQKAIAQGPAKKFNLGMNHCAPQPGDSLRAPREAFEPWAGSTETDKYNHWQDIFKRLGLVKSKQCLLEIMNLSGAVFSKDAISRCFVTGKFIPEQLHREMIKAFFRASNREWDVLARIVHFDVRIVQNDADDFDARVDSGEIIPSGNYIRVFQDVPTGWYWKFA